MSESIDHASECIGTHSLACILMHRCSDNAKDPRSSDRGSDAMRCARGSLAHDGERCRIDAQVLRDPQADGVGHALIGTPGAAQIVTRDDPAVRGSGTVHHSQPRCVAVLGGQRGQRVERTRGEQVHDCGTVHSGRCELALHLDLRCLRDLRELALCHSVDDDHWSCSFALRSDLLRQEETVSGGRLHRNFRMLQFLSNFTAGVPTPTGRSLLRPQF